VPLVSFPTFFGPSCQNSAESGEMGAGTHAQGRAHDSMWFNDAKAPDK
jgi:hypothetical protein